MVVGIHWGMVVVSCLTLKMDVKAYLCLFVLFDFLFFFGLCLAMSTKLSLNQSKNLQKLGGRAPFTCWLQIEAINNLSIF